jgi:hypothetical protein
MKRDLGCEWDPMDVISIAATGNEYDCLMAALFRLLERNASEEPIFRFSDQQTETHFGMLEVSTTREFARGVRPWHDRSWPASTVPRGLAG